MSPAEKIRDLAADFARQLKERTDERVREMKEDDKSHLLIYRVLGVTDKEGELIDVYQNKGRFLYRHAGSFLEQAAKVCYPTARVVRGAVAGSRREGGVWGAGRIGLIKSSPEPRVLRILTA